MKPYQQILIQECGEPLIAIPLDKFSVETPPPYEKLGANYGDKSPYYLRQGVLEALIKAQDYLDKIKKGWKIKVFDAYRPLQVQQFMVDYTFDLLLKEKGLKVEELSSETKQKIWDNVYQFWAIPSANPDTPPPHSTGAAIDVTLVNNQGITVNMGGEIDEVSEISYPNFYANTNNLTEKNYHENRLLLNQVMEYAGFLRHPNEWWHFSQGDQLWAWLSNHAIARYGRVC
jgi:zinc D-Ala-D-Ala dipeptidase